MIHAILYASAPLRPLPSPESMVGMAARRSLFGRYTIVGWYIPESANGPDAWSMWISPPDVGLIHYPEEGRAAFSNEETAELLKAIGDWKSTGWTSSTFNYNVDSSKWLLPLRLGYPGKILILNWFDAKYPESVTCGGTNIAG